MWFVWRAAQGCQWLLVKVSLCSCFIGQWCLLLPQITSKKQFESSRELMRNKARIAGPRPVVIQTHNQNHTYSLFNHKIDAFSSLVYTRLHRLKLQPIERWIFQSQRPGLYDAPRLPMAGASNKSESKQEIDEVPLLWHERDKCRLREITATHKLSVLECTWNYCENYCAIMDQSRVVEIPQ